ncbi:MAG: hypothetical protein KBA46_05825, partial [Candidatus Omnitrophica bacterium]|nr:hypothetical protein [Candidatus Omnitrophota bacterium]
MQFNQAVAVQEGWSAQQRQGRIIVQDDIIEEHIQALDRATPDLKNPPNVIVDYRTGAASTVFSALAERKGYQIVVLDSADSEIPDAIFEKTGKPVLIALNATPSPGMEAGIWDPSKPEAYDQIKKVQLRIYGDPRFKGKQFAGIVFDGDGDRSGFLDEGTFDEASRSWRPGEIVAPDRMLMSFYQRFVLENIAGIKALNKLGHTVKLALDVRASAVIVQVLQDIAQKQKIQIDGEFIAAGYPNHRGFVRKEVSAISELLAAGQSKLSAEELAAVHALMRTYTSAEASGHFFFNVLRQEQFFRLKTVVDDGITSSIIYLRLVDTLGDFELKGAAYREPSVKKADAIFPINTVTNEVRLEKAPADVTKKQALAERIIMKFAEDNAGLIPMPVSELAERVALARSNPPERQSAQESLLLVDGVRLVLNNGLWVLFRKSNTSAVITFKAEADAAGKEAQMGNLLSRLLT